MTAYEQRSYPGAAADTLLNADLASNGLTFSVTPGTGNGYPTGGSGPFFVAIDYDTSKAEKIRVTSRINDTFTIATTGDRGVDGTSAVAHSANAKVRAVWTATDAQEANRAAANTVGKVTTKGDILAATGANALARVAAGADGTLPIYDSSQPAGMRAGANPTLTGATLDATSTVGGVSGGTFAADHAAWTAGSVQASQGGATPGQNVNYCRYVQVGKTFTMHFSVTVNGAGAGINTPLLAVPVNPKVNNLTLPCGSALFIRGGVYTKVTPSLGNGTNVLNFPDWGGQTLQSGDLLVGTVTYETV